MARFLMFCTNVTVCSILEGDTPHFQSYFIIYFFKDLVSYCSITFHNNYGTSTGNNAGKWHLIYVIKVLIFTIDELIDSYVVYILEKTNNNKAVFQVSATYSVDRNYNLRQNI